MKKLLPFILLVTFTVTLFSQTTYTVNSVDDLPDNNINDNICADVNGNCTLRAAIENANKTNTKDRIEFNILGTAPFTIAIKTSELPAIAYPIIIDGRTQTEYSITNSPVIEIDGSGLPRNNSGLKLYGYSNNSEIYGLSIGGFRSLDVAPYTGGIGIDVFSNTNTIQGNYIGLKPDGTTLNRNQWGVYFLQSGNNTFGGTGVHQGNVVSGNFTGGVTFSGIDSANNIIQGNLLGTDATGLLGRGNRFNLQLLDAPNNTVGGTTPEARNIISAGENNFDASFDGTGISISGTNSTNITIKGNYIGTDITGTAALENIRGGILLLFGANNITIGGAGTGEGNVISGNGQYGIYLQGNSARPVTSNTILGNYIGVDATGNVALPNTAGIMMLAGENNNNIIGGTTASSKNVISGNNLGIAIVSGENNRIIGNYIGTNADGTAAVANNFGVSIDAGNNTVGGNTAGSRNLISGNNNGIHFDKSSSSGSSVRGNYIGLDASGNGALPNGIGVYIDQTATNITVGGINPLERNIISGNSIAGLHVLGSSSSIKNNYIGLNASGNAALPNNRGLIMNKVSTNNVIGGDNTSDRNIISGNSTYGISVSGTSNIIENNYVGLNPAGTGIISNESEGLVLIGDLTNTKISENTISGNGTIVGQSRNVNFMNATNVHFFRNKVGTLPDGNTGITNIGVGLLMSSSSDNIIGGATEAEGNIIGNHNTSGIQMVYNCSNNTISNNKIGVGLDGVSDLGNNLSGIVISGTNTGNLINYNTIANNQIGVDLDPALGIATQVTISENSIYNNTVLGIDLKGATVNDVGDADTGVNNLQNSPEVSAINFLGGNSIEITFEVTSAITNSAYPLLIEFFGAANGQGKSFIDSYSYTAPGVQTITINLPSGYDPNDYENIVATATDANGNTSEFGVNVSYSLSVSQFENQMVKFYPNPVADKLFIQSPSSRNFNLKLVNSLGQLVMSQESNSASAELNLSSLSSGLYFLNIADDNKNSQTIKIIKN